MIEPASFRAHAAVPLMNPIGAADLDEAIAGLELPSAAARAVETGCGVLARARRVPGGARRAGRAGATGRWDRAPRRGLLDAAAV